MIGRFSTLAGQVHLRQRSFMEYSPELYQKQLEAKLAQTLNEFQSFGIESLGVVESHPRDYRMRAEFRVWHEGEELDYVMFDQRTKARYAIDQFPAASKLINQLMPIVIDQIKRDPCLRRKLFQIDYLSTLSGEVLISLLYHRPIDEEWVSAANDLKASLASEGYTVDLVGRSRKRKFVLNRDYVIERLSVGTKQYTYQQHENAFTQPNGKVAEAMLEWAVQQTKSSSRDLLELYCGNGNFSIALAQNFDRVLATELSKQSVAAAQWNVRENGITNLKIARLSAEELTEAINGEREFMRLKEQNIVLSDYQFSTVLVDPPRSGIDGPSLQMLQAYDHILYISCNPVTLKSNLEFLATTHRLTHATLFDQFPYTHHREMGVVLERIQ